MSNIRACKIVGSDSISQFKMSESPWDDSKTSKLGAILIESEKRRKTVFHVQTIAPKVKEKRFSVSYCHW